MSKEAKDFYDNFAGWTEPSVGGAEVVISVNDIVKLMEEYAQSKPVSDEGKRDIDNAQVQILVSQWFEINHKSVFTEYPHSYLVRLTHEDFIIIDATFKDGSTDYSGLGNKYEFLWKNNINPIKGQ